MTAPPDDLRDIRDLIAHMPVRRIAIGHVGHPRLAFFAGARDADEAEAVRQTLAGMVPGGALADAVSDADADLRVYELDLEHPIREIAREDAARTAAYGMMAIEPGPDLFCLAAVSESDRVLRAICGGLARGGDALDLLARHGGRDTICLLGALVAARMAALPVILDGALALAAVAVMHAIAPHTISHCTVPQGSRHAGAASDLRLEIIPYTGAPFPVSLAYAVQSLQARRHGLA